jgi:hypothetical protein
MLRLSDDTIPRSIAGHTTSGRTTHQEALSPSLGKPDQSDHAASTVKENPFAVHSEESDRNQFLRKRRQSLLHLFVVGLSVGFR